MALNLKELKAKELYKQEVEGLNSTYSIIVKRNMIGVIKSLYEKGEENIKDEEVVKEICNIICDKPEEMYSDMVAMDDGFLTFFEVFVEIIKSLESEFTTNFAGDFSQPTMKQVKR